MDRYAKTFTVRWADCDVNGHMRNTAYSEYAIDVRMAFLAEHGFGFEQFVASGFGPVLLREEIDYLRELKLGDTVEVDFTQLGLSRGRLAVPARGTTSRRRTGSRRRASCSRAAGWTCGPAGSRRRPRRSRARSGAAPRAAELGRAAAARRSAERQRSGASGAPARPPPRRRRPRRRGVSASAGP